MTALEEVMQMKQQGRSEPEIINALKNQGVSPLEISNALAQSKIKSAVTDDNPSLEMSPSIMEFDDTPAPEETYTPQPEAMQQQQEPYYDQYSQGQMPQATYQDTQNYGGYDDYGQDAGFSGSTDTMIEVAEQVFSEKIGKLQKEIKELSEFKTIFSTKVENINHRLERMEKYFDKMQLEVLGKVSEYGKGLDYMKKELKMVEDSFGKMNSKL